MGRAPCCEKNGLKKGPWTPEEDQKLIDYIQRHGHGSWRALPKNAGLLRCGKSCRLRWTNYLRPDIKRGKFSFEEEQTIIQLHGVLGNKWSAIAAQIPGRTDNEIKNYWNTHLKKRLLQMGIDPVTHRPRMDLFDLSNMRHFLAAAPNSNLITQMARWENAKLEGLRREYVLRLAAMLAQQDQNVGNCSMNDVLISALQSRSQMNDIGSINASNFCRDQFVNSVLCNWAQLHPDRQNLGLDHYYNMLAQEQLQIQAQMSRCSAQNADQSCSSLAPGHAGSTISSPSFPVAQHLPSPTSTLDGFQLQNPSIKMEPQAMNLQNENLLQSTERILQELLQDPTLQADKDAKGSGNSLLSETSMNGFIANIFKASKSDLPAESEPNSGCSSHPQWPDHQDQHQPFDDANCKLISSDAAEQSVPALISSASSPNIFSEADPTNNLMPENSSTMLSMDNNNYGVYAFPPDLLLDFSTEITSSSCTDNHHHHHHHHAQKQQDEATATTASGGSSWSEMKSEDAKDYWTNMLNYTIGANLQQ